MHLQRNSEGGEASGPELSVRHSRMAWQHKLVAYGATVATVVGLIFLSFVSIDLKQHQASSGGQRNPRLLASHPDVASEGNADPLQSASIQSSIHDAVDSIAKNADNFAPAIDTTVVCESSTEVGHRGSCYYLDGSNGVCDSGYELAPQSILAKIAPGFAGKTYKHVQSSNCCIRHANEASEFQDWGFAGPDCDVKGSFFAGPTHFGSGCKNLMDHGAANVHELTLCKSLVNWLYISSSAACDGDNGKSPRTSGGDSYTFHRCKADCIASAGCKAIDFYHSTGRCDFFRAACSNPRTTRDGASSYKLEVPSIIYRGCYIDPSTESTQNFDKAKDMTLEECAKISLSASFAMQYQHGGKDKKPANGKADCLHFNNWPTMKRAPDAECGEALHGQRWGSSDRLAVYLAKGVKRVLPATTAGPTTTTTTTTVTTTRTTTISTSTTTVTTTVTTTRVTTTRAITTTPAPTTSTTTSTTTTRTTPTTTTITTTTTTSTTTTSRHMSKWAADRIPVKTTTPELTSTSSTSSTSSSSSFKQLKAVKAGLAFHAAQAAQAAPSTTSPTSPSSSKSSKSTKNATVWKEHGMHLNWGREPCPSRFTDGKDYSKAMTTTMQIKVLGIDYARFVNDKSLVHQFKDIVEEHLLEPVGVWMVSGDDVCLQFWADEKDARYVEVNAWFRPLSEESADQVTQRLNASNVKEVLSTKIVAGVLKIPGIVAVTTGPVNVSFVHVHEEPTKPAASKSFAWKAFSYAILPVLGMCCLYYMVEMNSPVRSFTDDLVRSMTSPPTSPVLRAQEAPRIQFGRIASASDFDQYQTGSARFNANELNRVIREMVMSPGERSVRS